MVIALSIVWGLAAVAIMGLVVHASLHARRARPTAPTTTVRTLLLVTPTDSTFTDAVKSTLIDLWGDLPVTELAAKSVVDMAFEFKVTFPDPQYGDAARLRIAKAVHALLRDGEQPPEPASGGQRDDTGQWPIARGSARRYLQQRAAKPQTVSGMNATVQGGVYSSLNISGMNATVRDAIVLHACTVSGMNATGRVLVPPGTVVNISGMNADVDVVQLSWEALAEQADKQQKVKR